MFALPALLFSAALALPMQGQKQGSDYVLHIRHLDADGAGTYLTTVYHYDAKVRVSKSISETLQGGTETEELQYTFRGKPKERTLTHSAAGVASLTRKYVYTYDGSERLKSVSLSLDGGAAVTHAEAEYDEYGRTEKKRYHGTAELETDYTYNLRGWQTAQESAQFSQRLYYEDTPGGLYDGNIRKSEWATGGSPTQSYTYTYDERGFLTESSYSEGTGSNPGRYTERQSYDKMGNILTQEPGALREPWWRQLRVDRRRDVQLRRKPAVESGGRRTGGDGRRSDGLRGRRGRTYGIHV